MLEVLALMQLLKELVLVLEQLLAELLLVFHDHQLQW